MLSRCARFTPHRRESGVKNTFYKWKRKSSNAHGANTYIHPLIGLTLKAKTDGFTHLAPNVLAGLQRNKPCWSTKWKFQSNKSITLL